MAHLGVMTKGGGEGGFQHLIVHTFLMGTCDCATMGSNVWLGARDHVT
jgi:hypothetical protein